jgi:PAS domain S-box-containing protein
MKSFLSYVEKTVPKRQQQSLIEEVAQNTPDIIYVLDLQRRKFVFINDRVSNILGYDPEYIYNQGAKFFLKKLHPEDYLRRMQHITACKDLKEHQVKSIDVRIRIIDNTWRWFRIRDIPFKFSNGKVIETIGVARDIHELKQAEEQIRQKEALLRAVVNVIPERLQAFKAIRNNKGEIEDFEWTLINKAAEDYAGNRLGKRMVENFPGVVTSGLFEKYKQVVNTGNPLFWEFYYGYDGVNKSFRIFAVKENDGFIVITYDIPTL